MRLPLRVLSAVAPVVAALVIAAPAGAFLFQETGSTQSATNGIAIGPDGNLWVAEEFSDSVVRLTPAGAVLNRYAVGIGPTSVTTGPGGRVWVAVTGAQKLVWFDATSPAPSVHDVPTTTPGSDCGPAGIAAGSGRMYFSKPRATGCSSGTGLGWVADDANPGTPVASPSAVGAVFDLEVVAGKLFAPDFDGDVVRRLSLPGLALESTVAVSPGSGADGVTSDGAGNVWVTEYRSGAVARFPASQSNGAAAEFRPSGGALTNPFGIVAGADGRIYVAGIGSANVVRITADGSSFAFYPLANSEPFNIINGPDGEPWLTDRSKTRILRLVNGAPRVTTGAAAATAPTSGLATASVNPRGNDTQVVFDYGPTAAYGAVSAPVGVANGADPVPVTGVLAGLAPTTTYHVRVRATNAEGSMAGADATFTTPAGIVDADHDGVSPPRDCRDDNPAIRPGAVDKPGDKIDQDCSGSDAPYPELTATVVFAWTTGRTTVINRIDISRLRGGETATIRCAGARCPFKTKRYTRLKKGKRGFGRSLLRGRRLTPGTTVTVRVTAPRTIGTYTSLRVVRNKRPKIARACLKPGQTKPSPCT